jgi:hypothetical protein
LRSPCCPRRQTIYSISFAFPISNLPYWGEVQKFGKNLEKTLKGDGIALRRHLSLDYLQLSSVPFAIQLLDAVLLDDRLAG